MVLWVDEFGISFNWSKSSCLLVGPNRNVTLGSMSINNTDVKWVDKMKYLGLVLASSKKFSVDLSETRRKFFISLNTILNPNLHLILLN